MVSRGHVKIAANAAKISFFRMSRIGYVNVSSQALGTTQMRPARVVKGL